MLFHDLQSKCGCEAAGALLPATLRAALRAPSPPAEEARAARVEALRPGGWYTIQMQGSARLDLWPVNYMGTASFGLFRLAVWGWVEFWECSMYI
jgi:hypothetical protein